MNLLIFFSIILAICVNGLLSMQINYSGFSLVVVVPGTINEIKLLQNVSVDKAYKVDFWSHPYKVNNSVNVLVLKTDLKNFTTFLDINVITYTVENINLNGYAPSFTAGNRVAKITTFNLNAYNTYNDAMQWVEKKANSCKICEFKKIGTTIQNRSIYLIKIGTPNNKGIFIDANLHAREWIAGASALQLINILTNASDPVGQYLTSKRTFHIVPIANPDGYEYSRTTHFRFWRKNRNSIVGSSCVGIDPNRNYKTAFGGEGSSGDSCDETFRGPSAFSESETKSLSNYIRGNQQRINAYVALHSYGRLILLPWGCNYSKPADYDELLRVGNAMNAQIEKSTGICYDVIPGSELYPAGGASDDWAKEQGIKYVYTIEMGPNRFDPPANQISALSKEFIEAIRGMVGAMPRS